MGPSIRGADRTLLSRTIASWRPTCAAVTLLNFSAPVDFRVKATAGWFASSTDGRALRRSLPVIDATAFSR
jgi:hypothetical protein